MNAPYQNLAHEFLAPGTTLNQAYEPEPGTVSLDDSAALVYTDLSRTRAFTASPTQDLEQVNDKMIACGVRLLFVTDGDGNLLGLVTYSDLYGDKPVRYIQEHGGTRADILAQDVMTPLPQLEALRIEDVNRARVGDIVHTIKSAGRQHMLIRGTDDSGRPTVTGLFSSTHIEKLLGVRIELSARAQSFAELERALG